MIAIFAVVNTVGYLAVIWAFRASFRRVDSATWWFALGFALLAGAIILRGLYWDVAVPLLTHPDDVPKERMINVFFSAMKMAAFFCALKCRQMLIPAEEREQWPWYLAWMHPARIRRLPWM